MDGRAVSEAAQCLPRVLAHDSIRRIELAWVAGVAADWAYLVILLVVAYDEGGAVAVGVLGAVRMIPATVAAPFATTLVAHLRGDRTLTAINVTRFLGALATALSLAAGLPLALTFALAAVVAGAGALVRPIQYALLPALARSPDELVAANVTTSIGESVGAFAGPLLAGLVIATSGSVAASVLVAVVFAGAAAAIVGIRFEYVADAHGGSAVLSWRRGLTELASAPHVFARYRPATIVVSDFVAQVFVRGVLITLTVVAALGLLDMGRSGVGALNAAIGLGGLLGSVIALGFAAESRLVTVFVIALAGWGLPLALIGAWPTALLAIVALFVTGVSNALLDVSGFTLVQRGVRAEDRVTVFGVMEGAFGLSLLVGSLAAPALVAALGTRGALVAAGAILPILAIVTARPIARGYRSSAVESDRLALLRSVPLFAPLPLTALERLVESLDPVSFDRGGFLMRQGEAGDRYLVIESGEVDVREGDRTLRTCGSGEGIGEIALLRCVPRTATAVARTAVRAYAIDSPSFLAAVAGPTGSAAAEAIVETRLAASGTGTAPAR